MVHRVQQGPHEVIRVVSWAPDEDFPVFPVGSKPKRLLVCPEAAPAPFLVAGHRYLFKTPSGWQAPQVWSEILAYELSRKSGTPVPPCFFAIDEATGELGVLVEFFYGYPGETVSTRFVPAIDYFQGLFRDRFDRKTGRPHSVVQNITLCQALGIQDPVGWWARALTFDALIGNTDRHPENWGFLFTRPEPGQSLISMAPLFDNGTSFGYERTDAALREEWSDERLNAYISKGTHHCGWSRVDVAKGYNHVALCHRLSDKYAGAGAAMESVIRLSDSEIDQIIDWVAAFDLSFEPERAKFISRLVKARRDYLRSSIRA